MLELLVEFFPFSIFVIYCMSVGSLERVSLFMSERDDIWEYTQPVIIGVELHRFGTSGWGSFISASTHRRMEKKVGPTLSAVAGQASRAVWIAMPPPVDFHEVPLWGVGYFFVSFRGSCTGYDAYAGCLYSALMQESDRAH